jgi:ABC-2 type transport system ATP-binding protein
MTSAISTSRLTRKYHDAAALDDLTLDIADGRVTGLLGRNGAGKSTLMRIVAGQEFATGGTVRVFGAVPLENDAVLRRIAFVREDQSFPDIRVGHAVQAASWFYPKWDDEFAASLLDDFRLPPRRAVTRLSRGMRSALSIVIGLAARADLTLFDEPYAGLDAVARQLFYDRLLTDYAENPRAILLSTHLIDEVADALEHVVVLDRGRVVLDAPADDVRGTVSTVSGPRAAVDEYVAERRVLHHRAIGSRAAVTIAAPVDATARARALALGVTLEPLSLQQLLVHASGETLDVQRKVSA